MPIFLWEQKIIDIARTWPRQGFIYDFFFFWTDFSQSRWALLIFILFLFYRIGWRRILLPSLFTIIAVGLADLISMRIVKALVMRPRPNFIGLDCSLSNCWGFVSSHSTNITAAAIFLCLFYKKNIYWALPIVVLVCFSRIYLIDHYPLDVLGGMILGAFIGTIVWLMSLKIRNKVNLNLPNLNTLK